MFPAHLRSPPLPPPTHTVFRWPSLTATAPPKQTPSCPAGHKPLRPPLPNRRLAVVFFCVLLFAKGHAASGGRSPFHQNIFSHSPSAHGTLRFGPCEAHHPATLRMRQPTYAAVTHSLLGRDRPTTTYKRRFLGALPRSLHPPPPPSRCNAAICEEEMNGKQTSAANGEAGVVVRHNVPLPPSSAHRHRVHFPHARLFGVCFVGPSLLCFCLSFLFVFCCSSGAVAFVTPTLIHTYATPHPTPTPSCAGPRAQHKRKHHNRPNPNTSRPCGSERGGAETHIHTQLCGVAPRTSTTVYSPKAPSHQPHKHTGARRHTRDQRSQKLQCNHTHTHNEPRTRGCFFCVSLTHCLHPPA